MLQTPQSSKKLQNDCFSKLFVRVFGCESLGCSGALISVFSFHARNEEDNDSVWIALGMSFSGYFSFHARNEEDVIVSRVEIGQYAVLERVAGAAQKCSRRSRAPKSFKMIAFQSFS